MELTCAKCGIKTELCESAISDGIKQPRRCKKCLLEMMKTGDENINYIFWIKQICESNDEETLDNLRKQ